MRSVKPIALLALPLAITLGACSARSVSDDAPATGVPAGALDVAARITSSTRHAEWVKIPTAPGSRDSIAAWVVYPERRDNAPVVVVIHEIFGLSGWVRGVADQAAADGYIAIAPDLLSLERGGATFDSLAWNDARALIAKVTPDRSRTCDG